MKNSNMHIDDSETNEEHSHKIAFISPACGCLMTFDEEIGKFTPIKLCMYHISVSTCGIGRILTGS